MEQKKYKILISDNIAQEGIDILRSYKNFDVDIKTKHTKEELISMIEPYHGIIVRSATKLTADVLAAAKNLKGIARAGTGYDNIDVDECTKRGIVVMITPLGNSNAVVELTLGLMLDFARHIAKADSTMRDGKWKKKKLRGIELRGKTVGIIGLGRIGAGVARRCQAFDMKILAYDKFVPKKRAEDLGVQLIDELNDILREADFLTLHIPLNEQNKNFIDKPQFDIMKSNAVIVNVARGGVVNEKALYDALKEKKIGGACIDVYSKEPANFELFPFIGLDNVITTPHLGATTEEAQINVAKLASEHLAQALNSKIFIDAVNIPFQLSEDMVDLYRPYMKLGGAIGKFISQYNQNKITEVAIRYKGEIFANFEPIKIMILQSIFDQRLTEDVTYMNIEKVLVENGINIKIEKYEKPVNFENYLKVYLKTEEGIKTKIAGTVFSELPKIVEIDGVFFDFAPENNMLALKNSDTPGVVGKVGTLLGSLGLNIASIQLGRLNQGKEALSIIVIDDPITDNGLKELKKLPQILEAHKITL